MTPTTTIVFDMVLLFLLVVDSGAELELGDSPICNRPEASDSQPPVNHAVRLHTAFTGLAVIGYNASIVLPEWCGE